MLTSLASLEREGVTLQGSLCSPLKGGGFGCTFGCTGKGYVERETSLALLERGMGTYSKVVVFVALLCATVRGTPLILCTFITRGGVRKDKLVP